MSLSRALHKRLSLNSKNICMLRRCAELSPTFISLAILLSAANVYASAQRSYTVEGVAEALLAAEAQFSNLRLEYTINGPAVGKNKGKRSIVKGTFARKMPEEWLYLDVKGTILDPVTHESKDYPSDLMVFNGKTTLHFYTESYSSASEGHKRAVIFVGRKQRLINKCKNTPDRYVWGYGGPYAEIIRKSNDIKIVNQFEKVDGHTCLKLVGTVFNSAANMTLWVCPELNFLPLKVQFFRHKDKIGFSYSTSDFVKLPNGLFYPQKITFGDPSSTGWWITMSVSDISIDPIPEEFFRPTIPLNTHVTDHVIGLSYTTGDAVDFGLEDLSLILEHESLKETKPSQSPELAQKALEAYLAKAKEERLAQTEDNTIKPEPAIAHSPNEKASKKTLIVTIIVSIIVLVVLALIMSKVILRKSPITRES